MQSASLGWIYLDNMCMGKLFNICVCVCVYVHESVCEYICRPVDAHEYEWSCMSVYMCI